MFVWCFLSKGGLGFDNELWVNSFVLIFYLIIDFFFFGGLFNELYFFLMYHIISYIVVHVIYSVASPYIAQVSD